MVWLRYGLLAGVLAITACSQDDTPESEPALTPAPEAPALAEVDPSLLSGLGTETVSDFDQTVHATWPVIPGAESLDAVLTELTKDRFGSFTSSLPESPPRSTGTPVPETAARPELNIGWSVIGASPSAIGVRLAVYEFRGASGGESWRTFWYDPASGDVRPNADLLAGDDALRTLKEAVTGRLIQPGGEVSEDDLADVTSDDAWPTAIGFADDGRLVVEFDQYSVAAGSAGRIAVAMSAAETSDLLSEFGMAAQDAAVSPADPSLPVATPEPTITAEPSPTSSPDPDVDCSVVDCVAVTYDDGPARHTDELLQILRDKDAVATFFVLGQQMRAYPDTLRAMQSAGHEIASHTWDHKQLTALSETQIRDQLDRTTELIVEVTGTSPTMMRPPYGATNDAVANVTRDAGLAQLMWSVDTRDWDDRDAAIVTRRAVDDARPGSIILLHDIHATTVKATKGIVDGLRDRGFTLVTISDLFDEPLTPGERYNSR